MIHETITPNELVQPLYENYLNEDIRYFILWGGRGGGRSYEASLFTLFCMQALPYFRGVCLRFSHTDLKTSCYKDLNDRINENEMVGFNTLLSPMKITFGEKELDFKGFRASNSSQTAKLKSLAGYNYIWIEELEEVEESDFKTLVESFRKANVRIIVVLTFNPPAKNHWIIEKWFDLAPSGVDGFFKASLKNDIDDTIAIHTTYKDNLDNINKASQKEYEANKISDPFRYYHTVKGFVPGLKQGLVYTNWSVEEEKNIDWSQYRISYGLDFGYNDPASLVKAGLKDTYNGRELVVKELFYERNLLLEDYVRLIRQLHDNPNISIIGDCSRPEIIKDLQRNGINILSSKKGSNSVIDGINFIKSCKSFKVIGKNVSNECQNYSYKTNTDKELKEEPSDEYNHALDAVRYANEPLRLSFNPHAVVG